MTKHIQIIAGPGNGKSTLAKLLGNNGFELVTENFSNNPFVELFYKDQKAHAFEKEITFLMQHYNDIKMAIEHSNRTVVFDFSLCLDRAYSMTTLSKDEFKAFDAVYQTCMKKLPEPDLLIHLRCPLEIERNRMMERGRDFEKTVRMEYLEQLDRTINQVFKQRSEFVPVLSLDSYLLDFTETGKDQDHVVQLIHESLKAGKSNHSSDDIIAPFIPAVASA